MEQNSEEAVSEEPRMEPALSRSLEAESLQCKCSRLSSKGHKVFCGLNRSRTRPWGGNGSQGKGDQASGAGGRTGAGLRIL